MASNLWITMNATGAAPQMEPPAPQQPDWRAIAEAHARIAPRIHRTPVLTSATLHALSGARLFFKRENLQKTGPFKIRGAAKPLFSLGNEQPALGLSTP